MEDTKLSEMHIRELRPDPRNARAHTSRGLGTLVDAINEVGLARSIVIDENDVILAGNQTVEAAGEVGITKVIEVEADGETIVAVRRRGLSEEQKKRLALYDNRAAEHAAWDREVLAELNVDGLLDGMFYDDEIDRILAGVDATISMRADTLPEPQDAVISEAPAVWGLVVECDDEFEQRTLLERFAREGLKCRALIG